METSLVYFYFQFHNVEGEITKKTQFAVILLAKVLGHVLRSPVYWREICERVKILQGFIYYKKNIHSILIQILHCNQ